MRVRDGKALFDKCYLTPQAARGAQAQYDLRLDLYRASAQVKATINARRIETHLSPLQRKAPKGQQLLEGWHSAQMTEI